jgi:hypothetical protein
MTISTQAPELQKTIVLQPVVLQALCQRLRFAQQRLQDRSVPLQLSALSYLRIVYSVMQTHRRLGLGSNVALPSTTPYLTLLNQLIERCPDWWTLCSVSEGYLVSDDCQIQALLQPLNGFVKQILNATHP